MKDFLGAFDNFSRQVKKEIVGREAKNQCCQTALCYGIACFSRYFDYRGLVLNTEQKFIAQFAKGSFDKLGIECDITDKGAIYEFKIHEGYAVEKMLALFGHTGEEPALKIFDENFFCEYCFSFFTAAAFLCAGTIVNPSKSYSLEFVLPRYGVMSNFFETLQDRGFLPKQTSRKGVPVIYFKASEQIEDLLTFMGAPISSMQLMDHKIYKDVRNSANRITNCETANIGKTVSAATTLIKDIELLENSGVLSGLQQPLQEAAILRKKYPNASLAELVMLSSQQVTKSGLNHRFKKIAQLAAAKRQNLDERNSNATAE